MSVFEKIDYREKLIRPVPKRDLCRDIKNLGREHLLISRRNFDVYLAKAYEIPHLLREIGRLRELTFRSVGEGTGKALDIDEYDDYYLNLFIWDRKQQCVVGGYRMGMGDTISHAVGFERFYINSLFEIDNVVLPVLERSIELGRSYIVPAYQKTYLPFFLLWQGILTVLVKNDYYQYLIGPVSISKFYSGISKSLIVAFVKRHFYDKKMAVHFRPRTPFKPDLEQVNLEEMLNTIKGDRLRDLEFFLKSIEPDHVKVPVLLKQYTKLNAKFISFNIDPNFSDALDGLMILDIKHLPDSIIQLLNEK